MTGKDIEQTLNEALDLLKTIPEHNLGLRAGKIGFTDHWENTGKNHQRLFTALTLAFKNPTTPNIVAVEMGLAKGYECDTVKGNLQLYFTAAKIELALQFEV